MSFAIHGLAVSDGIAIGYAHVISHALLEISHYQIKKRSINSELKRLSKAVAAVRNELADLKLSAASGQSSQELTAFVDLQGLFLDDPMLVGAAIAMIEEKQVNCEWALVQQMQLIVRQFEQIEDAYLRERKADVIQLVERLLKELMGKRNVPGKKSQREYGIILVAHDLSPVDTMRFEHHRIAGFLTEVGGTTSHTAIVARSHEIPAVLGIRHVRELVREDEIIVIDGKRGVAIVNPDESILNEYRLRQNTIAIERSKLQRLRNSRATTIDGLRINLMANIESPSDTADAYDAGAGGVGLYRTEFLFMGRDELPSENEQYEAYRKILQTNPERPVTIRTLDVGADKMLNNTDNRSNNPALSLRAIRYSLAEPRIFTSQLRALLRASVHGRLKILLPMLANNYEIVQTLNLLTQIKNNFGEEGIPFNDEVLLGGMIEVPAAAIMVQMLSKHLDFLSIGTNDLIQYTLAIDRTDASVAHMYDNYHPAVLQLIRHTIATADKMQKPISICGEMAGDTRFVRVLIGMGLREFSVHPGRILSIKQEILRCHAEELRGKVNKLMRLDDADKMRQAIERL